MKPEVRLCNILWRLFLFNNKQHNISNRNPGMGMIGGAFSPKAIHMLESARIQCCLEFEELTNEAWCSFLLTILYAIINLSSDVISKTDFEQLNFKFVMEVNGRNCH